MSLASEWAKLFILQYWAHRDGLAETMPGIINEGPPYPRYFDELSERSLAAFELAVVDLAAVMDLDGFGEETP